MRSVARALTVLAVLVAAACATAGTAAAAARPAPPPGTLYVLEAASGSLQKAATGGWRLVLNDPNATVTTFTDRPARVGGAKALRGFVSGWRAAFGNDPPNAALQLDGASAKQDVVLLELRRPVYDRAARTLTFRVRPLKTTRKRQLQTIARRADARIPARFTRASLFIDDGPSGIGYEVTFNLIGGVPGTGPVSFGLSLTNSQFQELGSIDQNFDFGRTVTPSFTIDLSAQSFGATLTSGLQMVATVPIDLPATGTTVLGNVTLPPAYVLIISSEVGRMEVSQSGPVSIPAPPPPGSASSASQR
jgi:hypothetical protein